MSNLSSEQWAKSVRAAFPDQQLSSRILSAAASEPTILPGLFEDISRYVLSLKGQGQPQEGQVNAKKRKLEDDAEHTPNTHSVPAELPFNDHTNVLTCKDVSIQVPARKKMRVEIHVGRDTAVGHIRLINASTSELEYSLASEQVDEAFMLPVPDKQARQVNFVLFPKAGSLDALGRPAEQMLFVMNDTPVSTSVLASNMLVENDTYVQATQRALAAWLNPHAKWLTEPTAEEFASSIPQSHRKGETAFHVKAHRAAKEGYLFFTERGIVFGFKKPLAFFPFSSIESISYTSVLQRTFNLVIATMDGEPPQTKEIEFSMLDQMDFAGIDAYVKRHGLNDASMAAQRRAKAYNVNKEKKTEVNGDAAGGVDEDGQTELQKAEQQLQDEEDEEEEDYEASGGESEGEGEDSEEEDEEYGDDEMEEVEGDYDEDEGDE